jgi:hypothetical protein
VVRGPNGFEWWCVYFAIHNAGSHSQSIDRVHFLNRRLTIDGPTTASSPGYHPNPAKPTFSDLFEIAENSLSLHWRVESGRWVQDGESAIQVVPVGLTRAIPDTTAGEQFLLEVGIHFPQESTGEAGICLAAEDSRLAEDIWLSLKPAEKVLQVISGPHSPILFNFNLPSDWNPQVFHPLRIELNSDRLHIELDDLPVTPPEGLKLSTTGLRKPNFYTENSKAVFDGVTYTLGWDEWDERITGWESQNLFDSTREPARMTLNGLLLNAPHRDNAVFKGTPLDHYEFSCLIKMDTTTKPDESANGTTGIYAGYVDADNWVKVGLNHEETYIFVETASCGISGPSMEVQIAHDPAGHFLRVVRHNDLWTIFVDGKEFQTINQPLPPSRVGLWCKNSQASFNDLT